MTKKYTGRCACGAVRFEFDTNPTFIAVCHCLDCKKASGGEAATFFGVPEDDFTLVSGEPKAGGLDRNFCPNCGARVFSTSLESFPGMIIVTLAGLDHPEAIEPVLEMFTKRASALITKHRRSKRVVDGTGIRDFDDAQELLLQLSRHKNGQCSSWAIPLRVIIHERRAVQSSAASARCPCRNLVTAV